MLGANDRGKSGYKAAATKALASCVHTTQWMNQVLDGSEQRMPAELTSHFEDQSLSSNMLVCWTHESLHTQVGQNTLVGIWAGKGRRPVGVTTWQAQAARRKAGVPTSMHRTFRVKD